MMNQQIAAQMVAQSSTFSQAVNAINNGNLRPRWGYNNGMPTFVQPPMIPAPTNLTPKQLRDNRQQFNALSKRAYSSGYSGPVIPITELDSDVDTLAT